MNDDNAAIQTFSSYHYTVYVPDNAAMEKAYSLGLPRWKDINNLANVYAGTDVNVDSLKTGLHPTGDELLEVPFPRQCGLYRWGCP